MTVNFIVWKWLAVCSSHWSITLFLPLPTQAWTLMMTDKWWMMERISNEKRLTSSVWSYQSAVSQLFPQTGADLTIAGAAVAHTCGPSGNVWWQDTDRFWSVPTLNRRKNRNPRWEQSSLQTLKILYVPQSVLTCFFSIIKELSRQLDANIHVFFRWNFKFLVMIYDLQNWPSASSTQCP